MFNKTLKYDEMAIAPADIYEQMGYRDAKPDEATRREVLAVVGEVRPWLQAQYCYFVQQALPAFALSPIIRGQLRDAEAYALFVCTAGQAYEDYQHRLQAEGDLLRVYIADMLGSVVAERAADRMEEHLQQSIDKLRWRHTNRFSPGYCGWSVAEQQQLFPLFGGQTCGVSLTPSSLMVPIKSVSGIIGLGSRVSRRDYSCDLCHFAGCYKRRVHP